MGHHTLYEGEIGTLQYCCRGVWPVLFVGHPPPTLCSQLANVRDALESEQEQPSWFEDFGTRLGPSASTSLAADLSEDDPARAFVEQDWGSRDPLSADPVKALGQEETLSRMLRGVSTAPICYLVTPCLKLPCICHKGT
jgi:hypothetical protein